MNDDRILFYSTAYLDFGCAMEGYGRQERGLGVWSEIPIAL
jgi:hypothetical protein